MCRLCLLLLLIGCAEEPEAKTEGGIEVSGTVSLIGRSGTAEVDGTRAFGFDTDGRLGVLISSNPDASCEGVAAIMASGGATVDPSDVYSAGTCAIWLSVTDYDGAWSHTWAEGSEGYSKAVASNLLCAMGDGSFDLVETVNGPGYQWSSTWWQGSPTAYELDFSGGDGDDFELDLRMTRYQGSLPLTGELEAVLAEGELVGSGVAKWCEPLADAAVF